MDSSVKNKKKRSSSRTYARYSVFDKKLKKKNSIRSYTKYSGVENESKKKRIVLESILDILNSMVKSKKEG